MATTNFIKTIFVEQGAQAAVEATKVHLTDSLGYCAAKIIDFIEAEEGLNGFKTWESCDFDETIEEFEIYLLSELHYHNLATLDRLASEPSCDDCGESLQPDGSCFECRD